MKNSKTYKLSDYRPYPFEVPEINISFNITDSYVNIRSKMHIVPKERIDTSLILKGHDLKLEEILINGSLHKEYCYDGFDLVISRLPIVPFELELLCITNPFLNTFLEGLYFSSSILTTQCEAEGFRRICFHPDRPDVLSKYRVRIEAEKNKYPVLLSNGNKINSENISSNPSRHEVVWEDPFPKPSYLFALVAGDLVEVSDNYITRSGRSVEIKIYVEKGDEKYTKHAIESLKKAMRWDEEKYYLEYDLDEYKIVAIRHFNMGAMENKGLNIFNSKLVLADSKIATDDDLERIESVIAHEYFHNWTGNRITCRDWFQLSLKEGLTVFRDQTFTADLHSSILKRIQDVLLLRTLQFSEDSGPTSHAVKPKEYVSIDNFYTTTIYEKGAELIRMLQLIIGETAFKKGMQIYLKRFDGCAVTTEDFLDAIFEGSIVQDKTNYFLKEQFNEWYYQPGTPNVYISTDWDHENSRLKISFEQKIIKSNNKNLKPLLIPILFSILFPGSSKCHRDKERIFLLNENKMELIIDDLGEQNSKPVLSLFRGFSAPVVWDSDHTIDDYLYLINHDDDYFSRWNSSQILMRRALFSRISLNPDVVLEKAIFETLVSSINQFIGKNNAFLAALLTIPGISELELYQKQLDPICLYEKRLEFESLIGESLSNKLRKAIDSISILWDSKWPKGQGSRKLTLVLWNLLALTGDRMILAQCLNAVSNSSMTLARSGLKALASVSCKERSEASEAFYHRVKDNPIVLDSWFSYEASLPRSNAIETVQNLLYHPKFDINAPNAVRALLGGFISNTLAFHSLDGKGYIFLAEQIIELDQRNPITASRVAKTFSKWKEYVSPNKDLMYQSIQKISQSNLSSNTREVIELILS